MMSFISKIRKKPDLGIIEIDIRSLSKEQDQMRDQIKELSGLLGNRYNLGQVANALTWMTSNFNHECDKLSFALVDDGQLKRVDNPFLKEDALLIYRYVAKKKFQKAVPDAPEVMFENMYESPGNYEEGATTDVIPGAYGEYGLCVTNPIPTDGIPSNETYLSSLSLLSGEPFYWERIGSFAAPNIEHPIDGYEIISDSGDNLCTIYISPYQKSISRKAPKGFYICGSSSTNNNTIDKQQRSIVNKKEFYKRPLNTEQFRRELAQLESDIEALEAEKVAIEAAVSSGTISVDEFTAHSRRLPLIYLELGKKSLRWQELSKWA